MYQLKQGQRVENEVQRIADKQLEIAIGEMPRIGDPKSDEAVHEARRHLKKIRALIRLTQPEPRRASRATDRRLRDVSRQLAGIADSESVVGTFLRLTERYPNELSRATIAAVNKALVVNRDRADRQALDNDVLRSGMEVLHRERKRVQAWRLRRGGFRAVAPGLETSIRRARAEWRRATAHPTVENVHRWRRRVKDHWFHVRLLQGRCAGALKPWEDSLAALDGHLGEYHNCALLIQALTREEVLKPEETARAVRLLRRYQRRLRRDAQGLSQTIYSETPKQFVRRVKHLWRAASMSAAHVPPGATEAGGVCPPQAA